jgi:hypothetical protein
LPHLNGRVTHDPSKIVLPEDSINQVREIRLI